MSAKDTFHSIGVSKKGKNAKWGLRIRYKQHDAAAGGFKPGYGTIWRLKRSGPQGKTELESMLPALRKIGTEEGLQPLISSLSTRKKDSKKSIYANVSKTRNNKWESCRFDTKGAKRSSGKIYEYEDHAGMATLIELHKRNQLEQHLQPGSPFVKLLNASGVWTQPHFDKKGTPLGPGDVVEFGDDYPVATIMSADIANKTVIVTCFTRIGDDQGLRIISVEASESVPWEKPKALCLLPIVSITLADVEYIGFFDGFSAPYSDDTPDAEIARMVVVKQGTEAEYFKFETMQVNPLELTFKGTMDEARLALHSEAFFSDDFARLYQ